MFLVLLCYAGNRSELDRLVDVIRPGVPDEEVLVEPNGNGAIQVFVPKYAPRRRAVMLPYNLRLSGGAVVTDDGVVAKG